jgi:hypothetical protein
LFVLPADVTRNSPHAAFNGSTDLQRRLACELCSAMFGFDKGTSGSAVAIGKGKNNFNTCLNTADLLCM